MSKRLIYLCSFVLVLGLALTSIVEAADPSLVGWWKFNESSGTTAKDSSAYGNDGTLNGDPQWVNGKLARALQFDGVDEFVEVPHADILTVDNEVTVMAWINTSRHGGPGTEGYQGIVAKGNSTRSYSLYTQSAGTLHFSTTSGGAYVGSSSSSQVPLNEWAHVAAMVAGGEHRYYINGEPAGTGGGGINLPGATDTDNVVIGRTQEGATRSFLGMIDDVRIYNRALTEDEIKQAMIGIPPGVASNASPANEATDVPRDVTLSWTPGEFAAPTNGHKVYFGQSFNNVNDATGGVAQSANSYTPPQRLDFNTTYYWRIDEVNAPPTSQIEFKSEVWSFTTEPFAYPIENITATASSAHQADTGPENTINGLGLDANDMHSIEPADMWLSGDEPNGTWIEYEFDKVHKLHQMWVWNHNGMLESVLGFGLKDVTIEYSTNGTDYTTLGTTHEFARAPGTDGYEHNTTIDLSSVTAKYIRLTTNSNWGAGLLDQYGLSEVRFLYIPVRARGPQPDSGTTDVAVDVTLGFRAGREADTHDVYLSTDEQAVIDGNVPVTTVTETSYGPLSLDLGTTYYWKINEVNEAETPTTWQGEIWNFTTPEFFVVDGFE
ncbi:MAG: discoidin domain-containing protein, partial [Planctomycetes bacterium]|nr:discoidin domain-containing protein [Planctomycetota bacterium]